MHRITNVTEKMYEIFDFFNDLFFDNELPTPVMTLQKERRDTMGHFMTEPVWHDVYTEDNFYEINLNPMWLDSDGYKICAIILHEMVHFYNRLNHINDTNGAKHNKKFAKKAEEVLLTPVDDCWGDTDPTDELKEIIDNHFSLKDDFDNVFSICMAFEEKETKPRKKTIFKYTCPKCGMEVKAKIGKNIMCGDCGLELEMEEVEDETGDE